ncbi:MAG TPA: DNA replication and repair protein RecF [Candidatus Saccharibacteria bacterium]|nr:DNA replication and repair protein RecF [Candidatus Saccharibacteria bacterium]
MSILRTVALYNFRSYSERSFEFSETVTVISGKNGTGKTNILESIYVLMQGKSFRDSDEQLMQYDTEWWKINGEFDTGERELRYQPGATVPKQLLVDSVNKGRFTYRQQLPVVLFEPDTLLLLHGSPSNRRAYLDALLISLNPTYRPLLAKYERALLQRNNILKNGGTLAQLQDKVFVWDIALAEYGSQIQLARQDLVERLNKKASETYSMLAAGKNQVAVIYEPTHVSNSQRLAEALNRSLHKDALRGFTSVGPHRDDVEFLLNGKDAKSTASRGEVRTIILMLKYIELSLLTEATGQTPLFLLDDVFSELDEARQKALLASTEGVQKIITTTHKPVRLPGIVTIKTS